MNTGPVKAIRWTGDISGCLELLDQTKLPGEEAWLQIRDPETVRSCIERLAVRGAPAIGIAGAFGLVLGARDLDGTDREAFLRNVEAIAARLGSARPTAVNLTWALSRLVSQIARSESVAAGDLKQILLDEAHRIHKEDEEACRSIGIYGEPLFDDGAGILTHCNAGALATGGTGTALAPIFEAQRQGKRVRVYADETRPLLQGARLTMWELMRAGIDCTLLCDNTAAAAMAEGKIQAVIVGADRIARNGDFANKIGTYGVAVLARAHGIPFYVAAPTSTVDLATPDGTKIPIENREGTEVTRFGGVQTAPPGARVYSPSFDVTPAHYATALITERGIARPVHGDAIGRLMQTGASAGS